MNATDKKDSPGLNNEPREVPNLAIFDLDYTLTKRGTWGRFVWQNVKFKPWLWGPLFVSAAWQQYRYKRGKIPRIHVKQTMIKWSMLGKSQAVLEALADQFAAREVNNGLRPGAIKVLADHRRRGDNIVIASAAVDILVSKIASRLEIDDWVATDMAWDNGFLAASFASNNCYGSEKLRRVEALLNEKPHLRSPKAKVYVYSDSHSDMPLFDIADYPIAVNPSARLRKLAREGGIVVQNWMQDS